MTFNALLTKNSLTPVAAARWYRGADLRCGNGARGGEADSDQ